MRFEKFYTSLKEFLAGLKMLLPLTYWLETRNNFEILIRMSYVSMDWLIGEVGEGGPPEDLTV